MPVAVLVAIQLIVDHAARKANAASKPRLVSELPPDIDQALVAIGYKTRLGAPAPSPLVRRIAVLSKAHQLANEPNPCRPARARAAGPDAPRLRQARRAAAQAARAHPRIRCKRC